MDRQKFDALKLRRGQVVEITRSDPEIKYLGRVRAKRDGAIVIDYGASMTRLDYDKIVSVIRYVRK